MSTKFFEALFHEDLYVLQPRTLVVIDRQWDQLSEPDQLLLTKILGSIRLTLASVQVTSATAITDAMLQTFSPVRVIAFGATLAGHKQYEYINREGISIVLADSLDQLDDTRKKNLWGALKQMLAT